MRNSLYRGLFRVWVVISIIWLIAVLIHANNDIHYVFRFYAQHGELVSEGMQFLNQQRAALELERDTLIKADKVRIAKADETYKSYMQENASGLEARIAQSPSASNLASMDINAALSASFDKSSAQKKLTEVDKTAKVLAYGGGTPTPDPRIQAIELEISSAKSRVWEPSPPQWGWLLLSIAPPILILVGGFLCISVWKWIAQGFSSDKKL